MEAFTSLVSIRTISSMRKGSSSQWDPNTHLFSTVWFLEAAQEALLVEATRGNMEGQTTPTLMACQ